MLEHLKQFVHRLLRNGLLIKFCILLLRTVGLIAKMPIATGQSNKTSTKTKKLLQ